MGHPPLNARPLPAAVVFDCDGLILDTEWPGYFAAATVFETHGETLGLGWWQTCVGTSSGLDWKGELERRLECSIDRAKADHAYETMYRQLLDEVQPLPGVRELIEEIHGAGVPIAVASSSSRSWVIGHLTRVGLLDRFRAVRGREDVTELKPAPEVYLSACAALDADPRASVALEDSGPGSFAVMNAEMACIAVPNRLTVGSNFAPPARQIESMDQIGLDDLVAAVAANKSS